MKLLTYTIFALIPLSTLGQVSRNYSNEFMNIGVDAAAMGMSNAVVSQTNDVNSCYWNPAGLVHVEDKQMSFMHASYFANIANYDFIAYAQAIDDRSSMAVSLIRFGVDDILDTTQLINDQGVINYDQINLFSAVDYGLVFSYGRRLPVQGWNYGINAKVIRRIIGDFASSWGFGFDIGIQFETKKGWKFGMVAKDVTTTYNAWTFDSNKLQEIQQAIPGQNDVEPESAELTKPKLQIGASKLFNFNYDYSLQAALDLNLRFEQNNDLLSSSFVSVNPALGLEFGYTNLVFLRLGVGNFQNEMQYNNSESLTFQPNFGIGFKYNGIQVDYAFTDIGDQSAALYSNIFSIKVNFSSFR